jgi:kumamolisin
VSSATVSSATVSSATVSSAARRPALAPELGGVLTGARRLGPLRLSTVLHLSLGLRGRNNAALDRLLDAGKTVPGAEYDQRFGPDPALVRPVEQWLRANGLQTSWAPGDAILEVQGTVMRAQDAFDVSLSRYSSAVPGTSARTEFYAPDKQPSLPTRLLSVVSSVLGLDDYPVLGHPGIAGVSNCHGASSPAQAGGFTPSEVAGFYDFNPLYSGGLTGAGQTIVFMEIDGFQQSDLAMYAAGFSLPAYSVIDPVTSPKWGTTAPIAFGSACGSETELDLEVAHAMAPGASLVVYQAAPDQQGFPLSFVADALQQAITQYPRSVYSLSLGWCEDSASAQVFDGLFTQLVAGGGTAFVSSGDNGAYARGCSGHNLTIEEPADSPHAVAVGGTTALVGHLGSEAAYGEEAAWGEPFEQWGAGGGLSTVFPRPSWQTGPGVSNQYSNGRRQVPDVSAIADIDTGWDTVGGGTWGVTGGTSAAAPLWAALAALTDQALAERHLSNMGFANPALYDFGANPSHFAHPAFHPVSQGDNLYYVASSTGWNFGTGWGSPIASALVDDFIAYKRGTR